MNSIIEWAWRLGLSALVGGNIFWIKRWINKREKWESEHEEKELGFSEEGGIVTRDKFFNFCGDVRKACSIVEMKSWRDSLFLKGGVMSKDEAHESFNKVTEDVLRSIRQLFSEHDRIAEASLRAIKEIIDANAGKLDLVIKRQQEVVTRIDRHIDTHNKVI